MACLLASCAREQLAPETPHPSQELSFRVSVPTWKAEQDTKGIPYGKTDKVEDLVLELSAYTAPASGEGTSLYLAPTRLAYNPEVQGWTGNSPIYWPDQQGTVRFFAYAPYGEATMEAPENSLPLLHYSAPEDISRHRGILAFSTNPLPDYPRTQEEEKVVFHFRHILSAVVFRIGKGIPIESISLQGVYDEGTYDFGTGKWKDCASHQSFLLDHPTVSAQEDGFDWVDEAYTLMLLPQTCPENATIHLVAGGKTLDIPIGGHQWKEGCINTYTLGRNDYEYSFEADELPDLEWEGGEAVFNGIRSWRVDVNGRQESVPWTVEGIYASPEDAEQGRNPLASSFISEATAVPTEVEDGQALRLTYGPAQSRMEESSLEEAYNATLAAAPQRGSTSNPWNLSNPQDGSRSIKESANTYVVSAPGYYRIPLVMGSGVKDNAISLSSFQAANFRDYQNNSILSPYLHESSATAGTPLTAYVIWETAPLVDVGNQTAWKLSPVTGGTSSITYDSEGRLYWLHFHIPANKIMQGLVHIAVADEHDTVMWSYLIWVTPEETALAGEDGFSAANLGWIEQGTILNTVYDEDTVYLRLEQQKIGGKALVVRACRPLHTESALDHKGYSPYYQFGRKDPLIPGTKEGDVAMVGRHPGFESNSKTDDKKESMGYSIRNPWLHLGYMVSPYDWCEDVGRNNWWGETQDVKTIYDPSPAGFRVPTFSQLEQLEDYSSFQPCGRRNSLEGKLVNVGKYQYFWSSTGVDEDSVRILTDDPEMSGSLGRRSRGLCIRPVAKN